MRYLAAIPVILLMAIMDLICIVSVIGLFVILDDGLFSYRFACKVWNV